MSEPVQEEPPCFCTKDTSTVDSSLPESWCSCPKDGHGIVNHRSDCDLYKNESFVYPDEVCECGIREEVQRTGRDVCFPEGTEPEGYPCECDLPLDVQASRHICKCHPPAGARELLDEWRKKHEMVSMPAVLEASHPLMQRFQQTLREFLIKENDIAEREILNLKDELRLSKTAYDKDLEDIYKQDHDCNAQRTLIEEYEATLAERTAARLAAEEHAKEALEKHKQAREQLDQDLMDERELREEMEALSALCTQLEKWRDETASDLNVSQYMSEKMRVEKKALADEKREMDVLMFWLTNEVWKLESKLEMMPKQMEIKSFEMENVNGKVAVYAAELEDLDLDKRRLVSLWNGVLNNISQRDKIFDSVREDYAELQENFYTLINNLEVTKKLIDEEMQKGRELAMAKEKIIYDNGKVVHLFNHEDAKRITYEKEIEEVTESIDMTDKDHELMKAENNARRNVLKSTQTELDRKINKKLKMENDILTNIQECFLNNKAVGSMANGIKNMREMSRKQEISLMAMESQHARLMLDLEVRRNRRFRNEEDLAKNVASVRQKEIEVKELHVKYDKKTRVMMKKQRELDTVFGKYMALKEIFDAKTPQQQRIEGLEQQIRGLRERTFLLQHDWLRQQGHVVHLTEQFQKLVADINLIKKQLQICEQRTMRIRAECDKIIQNQSLVGRNLREMRSRLQVLEKARKEALDRNNYAQKSNVSITQEYAVNLKGAEMQIIELEEDIDSLDRDKINFTQELDRVQREALIWQRKGILAVDLKKSMKEAKSAAGEIGKMRNEIHRMETRREQLRRTGEKLAEDLALYVKRRETAVEKSRAHAAAEKAHGTHGGQVSQTNYHHKLRTARADVASATKQLNEAEARLNFLIDEQKHLECEITQSKIQNDKLEEEVATLMKECREAERQRLWLLERVVRNQRLGSELAIVVKRQSLKIRKPKGLILEQYTSGCALNDRIRYVVERLGKDYPQFSDKLAIIANTLDNHSPEDSPRLAEAPLDCGVIEDGKVAEKPLCP